MPGLALAPERNRPGALGRFVVGCPLMAEGVAGGAEPEPGAGDSGGRQQAPPRQSAAGLLLLNAVVVVQPTSDGTRDSGSPSVSICWASAWVWLSLRVS